MAGPSCSKITSLAEPLPSGAILLKTVATNSQSLSCPESYNSCLAGGTPVKGSSRYSRDGNTGYNDTPGIITAAVLNREVCGEISTPGSRTEPWPRVLASSRDLLGRTSHHRAHCRWSARRRLRQPVGSRTRLRSATFYVMVSCLLLAKRQI